MKKSMTVSQNFALVNAKYKLNTSEMKFILTAITQLDSKTDTVLQEYEIKVNELEERLQAEQNETRLKQFAKKLMSKPLEVPTDDGWIVANWFSDIEYVRGQAKFKVRFSEKLKPYLLQLKERFVAYNLKHILPLTSTYSIRIYQLLKEYEKLKIRYFDVEELMELLQVPKSYKIYADFNRKVLQVAERELKEHTDIYFTLEEEKESRKVA
ncbi:MAG: replication initiation protein, partial [Campylobacterales bacterium]|nr:replication initiation protein [Campylobacterales bacterium]